MAEKHPYKTGHCGINHHRVCSGADGLCSCWCHQPLELQEIYQAMDVLLYEHGNPKIKLEMDVEVWKRLRYKALA